LTLHIRSFIATNHNRIVMVVTFTSEELENALMGDTQIGNLFKCLRREVTRQKVRTCKIDIVQSKGDKGADARSLFTMQLWAGRYCHIW